MPSPKITVITAVRNAKDTISNTIESVLSQSYNNVEYLVVDGMSSDGTVEIAKRYEGRIARLVSEPDQGIADAFNKGAVLATGEAVLYMNSGDTFFSTESLSELIQGTPRGVNLRECISYGNFAMVLPSGEPILSLSDHTTVPDSREWRMCHQSALIGVDVQRRFPYDVRLAASMDHDFWLRCVSAGVKFCKVEKTISCFLVGGFSADQNRVVAQIIDNAIIRLLNKRTPKTVWIIAQLLRETVVGAAKSKLRKLVGNRLYRLLKRAVLPGRSWSPRSLFYKTANWVR